MEEVEITLKLPLNQVNLVIGSLAELPFKVSADLINVIRQQAEPQVPVPQPQAVAEE